MGSVNLRKRRLVFLILSVAVMAAGALYEAIQTPPVSDSAVQSAVTVGNVAQSPAIDALNGLPIKGKAPKTGYSRTQFSDGWGDAGDCDVRNFILKRDMTGVITTSVTDCTVMQGTLLDPYTNKTISFVRGKDSSADVQIDHVVALSNAWQTGAQQISVVQRYNLANDQLNLLAVDGPANQKKSDSDAASWLPPNKGYRCQYVARQIAVKQKYQLWLVQAEADAMQKVLSNCPDQILPIVS
ncbi:MAG: HNH endonuclease family protein [Candidatus Saccharimonadales bacterium]